MTKTQCRSSAGLQLMVSVNNSQPASTYQKKNFVKEVVFLNSNELKKLEAHKFSQMKLDAVRDCFIFS